MKKTINRFLLKVLLFIIPVLVFFEVLFRLGFAPIVTDSTLFDLKMLAIQKHHIKNIKLLAMGSSITLYELNSDSMVKNFNLPYYNFASWGLQIADMNRLLASLVKTNHPEYIILCSSFPDFVSPPNNSYLNYINANSWVKDNLPELFYFKNYNSIHQIIRRKFNTYPLYIDNWGGASLSVKLRDINSEKWNERNIFPTKYTPENYQALESLSAFLAGQNIKLIFVQVPIKKSYTNTDRSKRIITAHFDTCRSIVEGKGGIYLNYYNTTIFTDSLFIDQYHLQQAGSLILTKEIVADLRKIIK
jgi:hypothetical protein